MKELNVNECSEEDATEMMMEIDKLDRLPSNNANIIQFLGYQHTDTHIRIFTKLYDGSLDNILKTLRSTGEYLRTDQIIHFIRQIMSGLVILHSRRM
jgi:serine/threonine protein kinase